jgi:hypothetical protein
LLAQSSPSAHHSFRAEFDREKPVTVAGTVTRIEWTNPHVWLNVDVHDARGAVTNWAFELKNPSVLTRAGWTRDLLKPGDRVKVVGFAAKNGRPVANVTSVVLTSTGQRLFDISDDGNRR